MIPQLIAIILSVLALFNCYNALMRNRDHKIKGEIALIIASIILFCLVSGYMVYLYSIGEWEGEKVTPFWQVYCVYNALTYAITTKRLSECTTTQNLSKN